MKSLQHLKNFEIENDLKKLVLRERQMLNEILEYIREVDVRKIYLQRAYSSLFDYLTQYLGYSASAAQRRIEAARLLQQIPDLSDKIQKGSVNLAQIGELARALKEKNKLQKTKANAEAGSQAEKTALSAQLKSELLDKIENKTSAQTQQILAAALDLPIKEHDKLKTHRDESVRIEMTLTKSQMEKLEKCKNRGAMRLMKNYSDTKLSSVIELLMDEFLKSAPRENKGGSATQIFKKTTKKSVTRRETETEVKNKTESRSSKETGQDDTRKTLTPKTKQAILDRDECCQFVDPVSGKMCGSRFNLQVDHVTSKWVYDAKLLEFIKIENFLSVHDPDNLQILCGAHNRFKYRNEMGLV